MGSTRVFGGASQKTSNGQVQQLVGGDEGGIGYVSLYFTKGLHAIPYQGVPCTLRNAKSGQYGGSRNFYMVTRGAPKGAARVLDQLDHALRGGRLDRRNRLGAAALVSRTHG